MTSEIEIRRYVHLALPTPRDTAAIVFRHWVAMLVVAALILIATIVGGLWTPRYEAQMEILVESRRTDPVVSSSSVAPIQFSGNNNVTEEDLNSEVELLKGNDLLREVAQKTGLVRPGPDGKVDGAAAEAAARRIGRNLRVEAVRRTHVISVRYSSREAKLSAAVLQALAAAYIAKHAEVHRPSGEFTFFDQEALRFQRELAKAENHLTEYSRANGVISAEAERDSALQQATTFDSKAHDAEASAAETQSRIQALERQLTKLQPRVVTSVRSADNSALLGDLKTTLLNLQLKKTELLSKYAPNYPLVLDVERQITQTSAAIQTAEKTPEQDATTDRNPVYELVQNELARARSELSGLRAQEAAAAKIAGQYRAIAQKRGVESVAQQNLMRDVKTKEDAYLLYVHKSEEAGISDALDRRGIVNVAVAENPVIPHRPQRSPWESLLLCSALLLVGSFSTAFALETMDPTFRTPDELATYLDAPVLAALPRE